MATRRQFVLTLGGAVVAMGARAARGQQGAEAPGATMEGDGYVPVRRLPRPAAAKRITALERDAVERMLSCPCPCTLDVFTCRTSMPCGFSPRLHADVVQLANGGYSGDEILAAFEQAYGEKILMAPHKQGFNWVGWIAPFAAVGGGALAVGALIRQWGRRAAERRMAASPVPIEASDDEMARLEAAIRNDDS
jgi:cytochrome c-type biogenesis protein CcmH